MGANKYIRESYQRTFSTKNPVMKARLIAWHKEPTVNRVEGPTNVPRARSLGYKATKQYIVVRVRISKGKRARRKADLGRKPGKNRKEVNPGAPLSYFAEVKAGHRFSNLDVVGVYLAGMSGTDKYFEVIMKDNQSHKPRAFTAKQNAEPAEKTQPKA